MPYTRNPINYPNGLVSVDTAKVNENFSILAEAFYNSNPENNPINRACYAGATPPNNPKVGQLWLDTSVNPPVLKVYDGVNWQSKVSLADNANSANQANSANYANNADMLDGFHASQTPQANTIPVAGPTGKLNPDWLPVVGAFNQVDFTSSGTWVVPAGVTKILIIAVAGGGGGAGGGYYRIWEDGWPVGRVYYNGGCGECGHGYIGVVNVVPGETLNITIGAGGGGGWGGEEHSNNPGGNGGNTIIVGSVSGTILNLPGGRGGGGTTHSAPYGYPSIFGRYNLGHGSGGDGGFGGSGSSGKSGVVRIIYYR